MNETEGFFDHKVLSLVQVFALVKDEVQLRGCLVPDG
jgi:hypothetical protein